MPAGNLDAMVDGGFPVRGKMDMPPVLLYFINKRRQEDIQVVDGFHPHIMALEPESRAFRESLVTVGRARPRRCCRLARDACRTGSLIAICGSGLVI
jgi:hypothetical protein